MKMNLNAFVEQFRWLLSENKKSNKQAGSKDVVFYTSCYCFVTLEEDSVEQLQRPARTNWLEAFVERGTK